MTQQQAVPAEEQKLHQFLLGGDHRGMREDDPERFTDMSVRNTAALLSMLSMMRENEAPRPAFAWKTTALVSATCTMEASRQTAAWAAPVIKRGATTTWSSTKSVCRWLKAHRPSITFRPAVEA